MGGKLNNGPVQETVIVGKCSTFGLLELQNTFTQAMRTAPLVQSVRLWDTGADEINVSAGETETLSNRTTQPSLRQWQYEGNRFPVDWIKLETLRYLRLDYQRLGDSREKTEVTEETGHERGWVRCPVWQVTQDHDH